MSGEVFNSVECYHPSLDAWRPVAEMCKRRRGVGVGVLDGVLYAVGGHDGSETLKSVEAYRPSTGVWTTMADMNLPRKLVGKYLYNNSKLFYETMNLKCNTIKLKC